MGRGLASWPLVDYTRSLMTHLTRHVIFLAVLALGLGAASGARAAANPYAGTYTFASIDTSGPAQNRKVEYGTVTVSSSGVLTAKLTKVVSGDPVNNPIGGVKTDTGTVSTSGKVNFPGSTETMTFTFVKSGTTVIGIQGTYKPGPGDTQDTTSGVFLGLK